MDVKEVCRIEERKLWLRDEIKSWQYRDTTDMNQLRRHREHVKELKELEASDGTHGVA